MADDRLERLPEVGVGQVAVGSGGFLGVEVVHRCALAQELGIDIDYDLALEGADVVALRDFADDRTAEVVLLGDFPDCIDVLGADLVAHPLLRFGEQNFEGVHVRFALVDAFEFDFRAETALGYHLARRAAESRRAEVAGRLD